MSSTASTTSLRYWAGSGTWLRGTPISCNHSLQSGSGGQFQQIRWETGQGRVPGTEAWPHLHERPGVDGGGGAPDNGVARREGMAADEPQVVGETVVVLPVRPLATALAAARTRSRSRSRSHPTGPGADVDPPPPRTGGSLPSVIPVTAGCWRRAITSAASPQTASGLVGRFCRCQVLTQLGRKSKLDRPQRHRPGPDR